MNDSYVILVVDDSAAMRNLIKNALNASGFTTVVEAGDGKEAIDMLSITPVNLIISDLNMPKVNGLELLNAVLNHPVFKSIPFIVLTSETHDETFKQAMKLGAADFIKKPFGPEELAVKIKSIIEWS